MSINNSKLKYKDKEVQSSRNDLLASDRNFYQITVKRFDERNVKFNMNRY